MTKCSMRKYRYFEPSLEKFLYNGEIYDIKIAGATSGGTNLLYYYLVAEFVRRPNDKLDYLSIPIGFEDEVEAFKKSSQLKIECERLKQAIIYNAMGVNIKLSNYERYKWVDAPAAKMNYGFVNRDAIDAIVMKHKRAKTAKRKCGYAMLVLVCGRRDIYNLLEEGKYDKIAECLNHTQPRHKYELSITFKSNTPLDKEQLIAAVMEKFNGAEFEQKKTNYNGIDTIGILFNH